MIVHPDASETPSDHEGSLRKRGRQFAARIESDPQPWLPVVNWLRSLGISRHEVRHLGTVTPETDPHVVQGFRITGATPFRKDPDAGGDDYRLYDVEDQAAERFGDAPRRLAAGWREMIRGIQRCGPDDDSWVEDVQRSDAMRIALLTAASFDADFDGDRVGLVWDWKADANGRNDGRQDVQKLLPVEWAGDMVRLADEAMKVMSVNGVAKPVRALVKPAGLPRPAVSDIAKQLRRLRREFEAGKRPATDCALLGGGLLMEALSSGRLTGDEWATARLEIRAARDGLLQHQRMLKPGQSSRLGESPPPDWHAFVRATYLLVEEATGRELGPFFVDGKPSECAAVYVTQGCERLADLLDGDSRRRQEQALDLKMRCDLLLGSTDKLHSLSVEANHDARLLEISDDSGGEIGKYKGWLRRTPSALREWWRCSGDLGRDVQRCLGSESMPAAHRPMLLSITNIIRPMRGAVGGAELDVVPNKRPVARLHTAHCEKALATGIDQLLELRPTLPDAFMLHGRVQVAERRVADSQRATLIRMLADHPEYGSPIDTLPVEVRVADLLTVLDADGLIEFGCRRHCFVGGERRIEAGWEFTSVTGPNCKPMTQFLDEVSAGRVDPRLVHHVRLTHLGRVEAARSLVSEVKPNRSTLETPDESGSRRDGREPPTPSDDSAIPAGSAHPHPSEYATDRAIAEKHHVSLHNLRGRLNRWRDSHQGDWHIDQNPRVRESKYKYRLSAVLPLIADMKARDCRT